VLILLLWYFPLTRNDSKGINIRLFTRCKRPNSVPRASLSHPTKPFSVTSDVLCTAFHPSPNQSKETPFTMMAMKTFNPASRKGRKTASGGGNKSSFGDKKSTFGGFKPTRSGGSSSSSSSRYGKKPFASSDRVSSPYQDRSPSRSRTSDGSAYSASAERTAYAPRPERTERTEGGYNRSERPSYGERPASSERPAYGQRAERPSYDRKSSAIGGSSSYNRSERPAYGEKSGSSERPAYAPRTERPAYAPRTEGGYNRSERPSYGDRPASGGYNKPEGRSFSSDRPAYKPRTEGGRPSFERGAKPAPRYERSDSRNRSRDTEGGSFVADLVQSEAFSAEARKLEQATQIHEKLAEGGAYTLYGKHAVLEVLQSAPSRVQKVLIMEDAQPDKRINKITALCESSGIYWQLVPKAKLDTMMTYLADATTHLEDGVETGHHQGVIAIVTAQPLLSVEALLDSAPANNAPCLIFALDEVTDPRNVGALLRVADAAGAKGMIIGKHRSAALNAVVSKTAAGADHWMPMAQATNLTQALELCKAAGFWIVGSACESTGVDARGYTTSVKPVDYTAIDYNAPIVVVLGNEGEGLRPTILKQCDFLANIPMLGKVQSLNVSTAGAVLAFEVVKQQQRAVSSAN
jgi:23S rRNA (guanosine2251-2'-O)-methyltransferase